MLDPAVVDGVRVDTHVLLVDEARNPVGVLVPPIAGELDRILAYRREHPGCPLIEAVRATKSTGYRIDWLDGRRGC